MKPAQPRKAAASQKGRPRRGILQKTLRFVGEHPKAVTTALAVGVGTCALAYRSRKAVAKGARPVADTAPGTAARVGARRSKRPTRGPSA
jgi:hypothetical protein